MSTLGIGVRVFIGWCPDAVCRLEPGARLRVGVIDDGPILPGVRLLIPGEGVRINHVTLWRVFRFDDGTACWAAEHLLTPINDGDETIETHADQAVTA